MPGQAKEAGAWWRDEIRNLQGNISIGGAGNQNSLIGGCSGVFSVENQTVAGVLDPDTNGAIRYTRIIMNASTVVPTGLQNVPQHIWQPFVIYIGVRA